MSRRPNVQRMRRAMERDEAHRLRRHPEFRVSLRDIGLRDIERADADARAWQSRVQRHFPSAEFTIWRDAYRDEQVMLWRQPRGVV